MHPLKKLENKKLVVHQHEDDFCWQPRLYYSKGKGKRNPRYKVKCGCCDETFDVYYDEDTLEINGVLATKRYWKEFFDTLLEKTNNA